MSAPSASTTPNAATTIVNPSTCAHSQVVEISLWSKRNINELFLHDGARTMQGHDLPFIKGMTVGDTIVWKCCIACKMLINFPSWSLEEWTEKLEIRAEEDDEEEEEMDNGDDGNAD